MKTAAFRRGDRVEVASEEEGFHGSYFEGNVVELLGSNQYKVEYVNLVKNRGGRVGASDRNGLRRVHPASPAANPLWQSDGEEGDDVPCLL
ncbi:unnamed protein product [Linum tenue]|uniref:Agenet domain-containing protein n=1 Tax=Linum tenue TaxID=586396 RepID=A0AAV0MY23_9ROSI|nr:unnamed protein product [Linum tenue]